MNIVAQIAPIRKLTATVGGIGKSGGKSDHQIIEAGMAPDAITLVPTVGTVTGGISDLSGAPPLTFQTAANRLYDYVIYGAQNGVGDYVGEPIFNGEIEQGRITFATGEPSDENRNYRVRSDSFTTLTAGNYTISATKSASAGSDSLYVSMLWYDTSGTFIERNPSDWRSLPYSFTVSETRKLKFSISYNSGSGTTITPEHIGSVTIAPSGANAPTITDGYAIPVTVTGKNLLENNCLSEQYNGLTVTVNADKSITVNGTATANSNICVYNGGHTLGTAAYQVIENGSYILSGAPEGQSEGTYMLSYRYDDAIGGDPSVLGRVPVEGVTLDNTSGAYRYLAVYIAVWNGATLDNVTFQPMLRKSTAADGYEPQFGNTVTFSIDKPLGVGETLSLSDTGTDIPTQANASNTLSVGTGVAPAEVYIRYKT